MVLRYDVIKAYGLALTRRAEVQHRAKQMKLRDIDGVEFLTYKLEVDDPAVGSQVKDLASILPDDCILVSVRRNGRVFVPHGETRLQPGDQVTAFVSENHVESVKACLKHGQAELDAASPPKGV